MAFLPGKHAFEHWSRLYTYHIYMTGFQKSCSQNRSDNAFPCVTPLLLIKRYLGRESSNLLTKTPRHKFSYNSTLARTFFQSDESEDKVALLLQELKLFPCCLSFLCLSFTAMRCRPFLLRCVDKSLWQYFASLLSSLSRILEGLITNWNMGSRFSLPSGCIFLLAQGVREKCN